MPEHTPSISREKVRILVVDDDPNILQQIAFILRRENHDIQMAQSGDEALEKFRDGGSFDLVVLDIMMPNITGLDVCREIRKTHNQFDLPIIIASALSKSEDVAVGLDAGANDYVTKPINRIELLARVRNLIALKQLHDTARANEELVISQAQHDSLTGLPNREYLNSHSSTIAAEAQKTGTSVAIIIFNIDNFKSINNALGYRIGDVYLMKITEKLKTLIEEKDLLCRLHTDTFAVLRPGLPETKDRVPMVDAFTRSLLKVITDPITIEKYEFSMTASAGIAFYPYENRSIDDVIRFADAAMYVTKSRTQNSFTFHSKAIHKSETTRYNLEKRLKEAIRKDEFVLYYQPQVATRDESLVGVEALIRWRQPNNGIVYPGEFIPVAEESGLIIELSEWVLRKACEQSIDWMSRGLPPIRIGVNLSAQHFHSANLLPYIKHIISNYNINPELIELEITEGCIMAEVDEAIRQLEEMRGMGFGLSVDDFGTGYSSLSYLKKFPIHTLKIDQSFIGPNISRNETEGAIVQSIIKLGHSLHLNVIAEGVETKDQLQYLTRHYCNEIQGYYYGRPVPTGELEKMIPNIAKNNKDDD